MISISLQEKLACNKKNEFVILCELEKHYSNWFLFSLLIELIFLLLVKISGLFFFGQKVIF